jgi:integrase
MATEFCVYKTKVRGKIKWVVDLRPIGKGRRFKDTKEQAQDDADAESDRVKLHGIGNVLTEQERMRFIIARDTLNARGATIEQAVEFFLRFSKKAQDRNIHPAIEQFIIAKERGNKRSRYIKTLENNLWSFAESTGNIPCAAVEESHLNKWLHRTPPLSPFTIKSYTTDLQTFFNFCIKQGWALENPCSKLEPVILDDKPPSIFTVPQIRVLMTQAKEKHPRLIAYLTLALFCGIRPEEIARLDWDSVNLETKLVEIRTEVSKTRKRRLVTIQPNAVEWLALKGDLPPINLRKQRAELCAAAGLKWSHDVLRHSFASYHLAMWKDAARTAHELGHYSQDMLYRHYRELVTPQAAKEFWEIVPEGCAL